MPLRRIILCLLNSRSWWTALNWQRARQKASLSTIASNGTQKKKWEESRISHSSFTNSPFNVSWQTKLFIIEKATGKLLKRKYQAEALFHFHHINAYEYNNQIIADVIIYEDATILEKYEMSKMRNGEWEAKSPPIPHRFVIPLDTNDVWQLLNSKWMMSWRKLLVLQADIKSF